MSLRLHASGDRLLPRELSAFEPSLWHLDFGSLGIGVLGPICMQPVPSIILC